MADADEDVIPGSTLSLTATNTNVPDYDPEDEAQDFRFLASLSGINTTLPKRGEKDFEPNPTKTQQNVLNASREAMHNALSVERIHPAKNPCVGVYLPNPHEWLHDFATEKAGSGARCVVVERFRGVHNKSIGKEDFRNWTWLLPEEALFLLERGSLDIRWPDEGQQNVIVKDLVEEDASSEEEVAPMNESGILPGPDEGISMPTVSKKPRGKRYNYSLRTGELPMSLQGAYACLIGKSGLLLERYTVYAGLRRLGYIVQRAPTWNDPNEHDNINISETDISRDEDINLKSPSESNTTTVHIKPAATAATSLINRLTSWVLDNIPPQQLNSAHGPLLRPGVYRNYNDIFHTLNLIPSTNSSMPSCDQTTTPRPPFNVHFTILKPSSLSTYRKSSPPSPDFLISVVDARTTRPPNLSQISRLLDAQVEDTLPADRKMEARLKYGRRNVLLAVVDCGVVSYLRVADMGFAENGRVHEEKVRRGAKGAGSRGRGGHRGVRGGGSGRGRGKS